MEWASAPASITSGSMPRRFAEMAHARPMGPAPAIMAASCGGAAEAAGAAGAGGHIRESIPLASPAAQQYCCYMARRVRANKSLIKQRYHAARSPFRTMPTWRQPGRAPAAPCALETARARRPKTGSSSWPGHRRLAPRGFLDTGSIASGCAPQRALGRPPADRCDPPGTTLRGDRRNRS